MNKTISVNIGGRVFNIEEIAFDKLNKYLNTIRGYFKNQESADEIISDIELRIAELFIERISNQKQVITVSDVDEIIAIMGQPEDYVDAEEEAEETGYTYRTRAQKQVFRDPDNKVVAGVCSGISAYFGIDPIILRAIFVIFTIFYGSGILIYVVLAIIIPKARTTAEKLQMRGEPVTVENISRKVNESFRDVSEDIKDFGKKNNINKDTVNTAGRRAADATSGILGNIGNILRVLLVILAKVIGAAFIVIGITGIFLSLGLLFGWESILAISQNGMFNNANVPVIVNSFFDTVNQRTLFSAGVFLTTITPAIGMLLLGIRLLFDFKKIPIWTGIVLVILWFAGITMVAVSATEIYDKFQVETSFTENVPLELPVSDTLYLDLLPEYSTMYKFKKGFYRNRFSYDSNVTFPDIKSTDVLYIGRNDFTVEMNNADTLFRLMIEREAHGSSQTDAVANAMGIESYVEIIGDSLLVHPYHAVLKTAKIRGQEIKYILQIPVGKSIHFNQKSKFILDDVPNVTDTWDGDMINQTWLMTRNGLLCTSCPPEMLEKDDDD
ncbi:PspC domain-containing protein [Cryomorpha ignava]|uniref:PspC domain-containing protein n=1 Tax=Cryomorpha ignava TaxID=101383 RepID=A0A7K3WS11_9FLAO|nr:PspC domain-containing protein [Cryomorpha ignava]NEN23642.1 PspC domain-containing protein [Cryomorpha ignava]